MECFFCKDNKGLVVKKYKYWTVLIHPYQCYIGRCMVKSNRHVVDLLETDKKEKTELLKITEQLKSVLNDLFKPDLFNYASLGNKIRHLHVHFIPRYKEKRVFENIEFVDKRWNRIHSPYEKTRLPTSVLKELKKQIRQGLG